MARKRKQRKYSLAEKTAALAALAANGGNLERTARQIGIPRNTLRIWDQEAKKVESAAPVSDKIPTSKSYPPLINAPLVQEARKTLAAKLDNIAHLLADDMARPEKIEGAGLNQVAVALGITIEKMRLLLDKPTQIHGSDLTDAERMARLASLADSARARRDGHASSNGTALVPPSAEPTPMPGV
jgi:transposase-like protein